MTANPQAQQLYDHLWRAGAYAYWWTVPGRRSYWFRPGELREAPAGEGINVYFGVHPCTKIPPTNADGEPRKAAYVRSQIAYIAAVNCLFGEFDAKDYEGGKGEARSWIGQLDPAPSVIIDSGGGYHCYWLLREPYTLDSEADRTRAADIQARWVAFVGSDEGAKDLARVLRAPGSRNYKPERGPDFPEITITAADFGRLYELAELEELLPDPAGRETPAPSSTAQERTEAGETKQDRYARRALEAELDSLARTSEGGRNDQLNRAAFALGQLVGAGILERGEVEDKLLTVATAIGLGESEARRTIKSGVAAGAREPRHLPDFTQGQPHTNGTRPAPAPAPAAEDGEPLPTLDSLIAELGGVEPGEDAQQWAVERISAAAYLSEPERLLLDMELRRRKVPKLFLDRQWTPAVRNQADEFARAKLAPARKPQRVERYKVLAHRISESREMIDRTTGEATIEWRPLCNFDARIVADVEEDDGEHISRNIAIVGSLCTGEPLPEVTIKAEDFEQMAWPIKSWGARVSVEPGRGTKDKLRHAIQSLSDNELEIRRVYTHTGWRVIDGGRVFLTASGGLGLPGITVNLPGNLNGYALPQDQAIEPAAAMRASLALLDLAPDRIATTQWAAMYLAPLSEIIPPAFVAWVEGESGSLKSSLSAVMLNHYGPGFTEFNLPAGWDSTANSLEKLCFHAKDVPLLIDDFRPLTNRYEAQKLQDAASKVIRAAGNRQGRSRLDSESDFRRVFSPRGVVMATAERGALGTSTNARLLTIDVNPGDITPARLGEAQGRRWMYSYAMAGYIRWVGRNYDHLVGELQKAVTNVRALQNGNGHKRLPGAMAALYTAFNLAMTYAQEIGAISNGEAAERAERCYNALQQIASDQAELIASQDPALQFLQVIVSLLRSRQVQIEGTKLARTLGDDTPGAERIGWHDGQTIYLLQTAYNRVARFVSGQGEMFPSDERTLSKELQRRGYLAPNSQGDNRIKVQRFDPATPGQRTRTIAIRLQTLFDIAAEQQIEPNDLYLPGRQDTPQE